MKNLRVSWQQKEQAPDAKLLSSAQAEYSNTSYDKYVDTPRYGTVVGYLLVSNSTHAIVHSGNSLFTVPLDELTTLEHD